MIGEYGGDMDVNSGGQITSLDTLITIHGRRQKAQGSVNFNYHAIDKTDDAYTSSVLKVRGLVT